MFRNKYTMIFHTTLLLTILLKCFVFTKEEDVIDVGYTSTDNGVPIEVDLDNESYYINKNLTNILIDGRTLVNYQGYKTMEEELNERKGIIITTNDFILKNELKNNPDFTFIPYKNNYYTFVFYEIDDYFYGIGLTFDEPIITIRYNAYSDAVFVKKSEQQLGNDYFPLYKIDRVTLETTSSTNFILYDIDVDDMKIMNDFKKINYKDQFTWNYGETILLSDLNK